MAICTLRSKARRRESSRLLSPIVRTRPSLRDRGTVVVGDGSPARWKLWTSSPAPLCGSATGAKVCFSRLELTLHGSPVLCLAADVVVLPLHTRHRHRQHATTYPQ